VPAPKQDGGPAQDADVAEGLMARISRQLDVVLLTRERIQEILDDAAARGRVTRSDANALVTELFQRGRQGREDMLRELEALLGRGREGLDSATRRVRRGSSAAFPIEDYDELTARQVLDRLGGLSDAELRRVKEHERRHGNRKTVLDGIERALQVER